MVLANRALFVFAAVFAACIASGAEDRLGDPLPAGAVQRLGTLRLRFPRGIGDLCWLPDGRGVVAVGGGLEVWDLGTGTLLKTVSVSDAGIHSVFSRKAAPIVLTADSAGDIAEVNVDSGEVLRRVSTGLADLRRGVYSADYTRILLTGGRPPSIEEWDLQAGVRTIHIDGGMHYYHEAVYGPEEKSAFVNGGNGSGHVLAHYSLEDGKLLKPLQKDYYAHSRSLVLSPDRTRLLLGSRHMATEWEIDGYKLLRKFRGHHGHAVTAVEYGPQPEQLMTGSRDGSIRLWNRLTGKVLLRWFAHSGHVTRIHLSPDGKWVLSYGGGTVAQHSVAEGVAVFPDGRRAVSASADGSLRIWDARSGESLRTISGVDSGAYCVALSADGRHIAAGCKDGALRVFGSDSGDLVRTLKGHRGYVRAVAFAPAGRLLSAAGDGRIFVWGADDAKPEHVLTGHRGGILALAVASDGHRCLSGGRDGTVRLWDLARGALVGTLTGHAGWVQGVAFLPDGERAVSVARDEFLIAWDLQGMREQSRTVLPASGTAVTVAPDGARVYAGRTNGAVAVCALGSEMSVTVRKGHAQEVNGLALSLDGQTLITASGDSTLLVWNTGSL
jgi:WD40 repeat protein